MRVEVLRSRDGCFRKPACVESGCSFRCISGLCPFGYDPFEDCFPYMTAEERYLFQELVILRVLALRNSGRKEVLVEVVGR